ncbi:hypothetical protein A1OQ_08720 [Enterovibrio norvegicus FF-162]|nr:hypothetical protein A1OQ_08720 [Enterovibrio norvegicus FF-162]
MTNGFIQQWLEGLVNHSHGRKQTQCRSCEPDRSLEAFAFVAQKSPVMWGKIRDRAVFLFA